MIRKEDKAAIRRHMRRVREMLSKNNEPGIVGSYAPIQRDENGKFTIAGDWQTCTVSQVILKPYD